MTKERRGQLKRLTEKHREGLLLWELENGFELSPKVSSLILETAKGFLLQSVEVGSGRQRVIGVELEERAGKSVRDIKKKEVVVTLDGGREDIEYELKYGRISLRQMRILRVIEEGIDQGVVFSEEDISRMFGVSVRTVKRDIRSLRKEGCVVNTRGYVRGIGRAISHKRLIVELYLKGKTYGDLESQTRHSEHAIRRYVETFCRVAYSMEKGIFNRGELMYLLGISDGLLSEYETLYGVARKSYGEKLEEIVGRYKNGSKVMEYKNLDRRKDGFRSKKRVSREVLCR
jgi:biotin operon repressor